MSNLIVGIDASRNRSGGTIAHLVGILSKEDPAEHGIREVHVWSYRSLLDALPNMNWLHKHNPKELEQSLMKQLWWQAMSLSREAALARCDILFATDASTLCRFNPMVVMSQDMLSYEPGIMCRFGYGKARLRLLAILALQNLAFRRAAGVIFLTQYASKVIQHSCGPLRRIAYIPHGVSDHFRQTGIRRRWPADDGIPISCFYVSNTAMYKNQWVVVEAVEALRRRGHDICLTLVGGGAGRAQSLLEKQIAKSDPMRSFVKTMAFVPHKELPKILETADLFVFASSCENLPVTLLEAMASSLPIACSNRGPMPEVLQDGGVYFDPEDADSIASTVEKLISSEALRVSVAMRAKTLSEQYTWARCASETWSFLKETMETKRA